MKAGAKKFKTPAEYLSAQPPKQRALLKELRKTIRQAAPGAQELISYNMPAYRFHGVLVYYAAYAEHIGFYPVSSAIRAFNQRLKNYETSKGTIRFPLDKKLPLALIRSMVKFRVKENLDKAGSK